MKRIVFITIIAIFTTACNDLNLVKNNTFNITSNHVKIIEYGSYTIPKGIFRGVLPGDDHNVIIWTVRNNEELFMNATYKAKYMMAKPGDKNWVFKKLESNDELVIYEVKRSDGQGSIVVELPTPSTESYSYWVSQSKTGENMIAFLDMSEKWAYQSHFSFIIVAPSKM